MLTLALATWRDQYERMHRSFARIRGRRISSIDYDDDVVHFFMDCLHLRDWILCDQKLAFDQLRKEALKAEINSHLALRIAADLANGWKHRVRTQQPKVGAEVTKKDVVWEFGTTGVTVNHEITLGDGSVTSMQSVAFEACQAWDVVLAKFGLDPSATQ